ncbi:MAG TPA: hypothetical protein VHL58_19755 [Thermoanaerobaculia bacterium]|nr:hypothetical protein [Thermoanaerobaculia bacterium]
MGRRSSSIERRIAERVRLSNAIIARFGTMGTLVIDVSDTGALVEHYSRCQNGSERILRLEWDGGEVSARARIVRCAVHRFSSGDDGLTVFRSGLKFLDEAGEFVQSLRQMISAQLATALVEQVANAKGFLAPTVGEMPIFKSGALISNRLDIKRSARDLRLLPDKPIVRDNGFLRCRLLRGNWQIKWTLDPKQPEEGFTILASETSDQVEMLCRTYHECDSAGREVIREMARITLESGNIERRRETSRSAG